MSNFKTDPFEFQVEGQHNVEQPKVGGRNACVKHCISSSKRNHFEDIIETIETRDCKVSRQIDSKSTAYRIIFSFTK